MRYRRYRVCVSVTNSIPGTFHGLRAVRTQLPACMHPAASVATESPEHSLFEVRLCERRLFHSDQGTRELWSRISGP